MGYEIAEQLGWRVPDVILYPTGGGVGLIGIHKALLELRELGWIAGDAAAAGRGAVDRAARRSCDAFEARRATTEHARPDAAHGRVRHQRAQGARATSWCSTRSRDDRRHGGRGRRRRAPRRARRALARARGRVRSAPRARPASPPSGACASPAGSAGSDEVVVLNTGTGLKYPDTVAADPPVLRPGDALPPR